MIYAAQTYTPEPDPVHLAEQVILGSLIDNPPGRPAYTRAEVFAVYPPEHFHGRNLLVAELLASISDERLDPFTVLAAAARAGLLNRLANGTYLHDLIAASHDHLVLSDRYLPFLVEQHARTTLAAQARQLADYVADPTSDPAGVAPRVARLRTPTGEPTEPGTDDPDLAAFMERAFPQSGWVVEGLLRRRERFMLTGAEGLGKSTLVRQFALAAACGLHPFRQTAIPQQRVLFVDLENDPGETQRIFRRMFNRLALPISQAQVTLLPRFRPSGLNVADRKHQQWLTEVAENYAPDLIVLTPLYKLHRVDIISELAARDIVDALDDLRERTGAALLIEAHSPLTTDGGPTRVIRPYGSSVFLRWPDFGRGLVQDKASTSTFRLADLVGWRGDRLADRMWPERLCSGDPLPWIEDRPR